MCALGWISLVGCEVAWVTAGLRWPELWQSISAVLQASGRGCRQEGGYHSGCGCNHAGAVLVVGLMLHFCQTFDAED